MKNNMTRLCCSERFRSSPPHLNSSHLKRSKMKNRKQLEIEREKIANERLDKKIKEQRMAIYLDFLEERKRGDFIPFNKTKCNKLIEHDNATNGNTSPNIDCITMTNKDHEQEANHNDKFKNTDDHNLEQTNKTTTFVSSDTSILANLGEVRRIMQHDHIEMLEKLLELNIK